MADLEAPSWIQTLGNDIVTIYVGKKRTEVTVHENRICSVSKFFHEAFIDGLVDTISLPEDDIEIFELFVEWLYQSRLGGEFFENVSIPKLSDLYVFADEKRCNRLMNEIIDHVQDRCYGDHNAFEEYLEIILDNCRSSDENLFRQFCLAWIYWAFHVSKILSHYEAAELLNKNFRTTVEYLEHCQLMHGNNEQNENPNMRGHSELFHMCAFHVHSDDKECFSKKTDI